MTRPDTVKAARAAARARAATEPLHQDSRHARGLSAIEQSIFAGVPVNVTLLFSSAQYLAAAEAYMRGIERRIAAGLDPKVASVASLFISRWDVAVKDKVPAALRNRLGHRRRQADLPGLPRASWTRRAGASSQPPGRARSGCSGRAPAPRIRPPPTRSTSSARRARYHQHHAGEDAARLCRSRAPATA